MKPAFTTTHSLAWLVSLLLTASPTTAKEAPPNVLVLIADDATYNDLPVYGGVNLRTPVIDGLAKKGLTFDRAFLSMSMCNPSRTELFTGLYPARNGACWNHSATRPGTKSIVHYLRKLGYRVGLAGKKDVAPPGIFNFDPVPGVEGNCVHVNPTFNTRGIKQFMTREPAQPFCLVVGLTEPHVPWTIGHPEKIDPKKLTLPANLADTQATRKDYTKYLAEIEVLDQRIGQVLQVLKETGQAENTLVIFTSEQGSQFPGNKWTNWNTGVHTGLIVCWPGKVQANQRCQALIQFADVLPTLVEVAGGEPASGAFDGRSFLQVLLGKARKHREYAYFMHNNIPEGPPYPIRAITDGTYHYIRNLTPEAIYIEKHLMGENRWHTYWPTWIFETTFNQRTNDLVTRYLRRPAEQLYHLDHDPYELNNLASAGEHAEVKKRLSAELDRWMKQQGDPGAALDTREQWQASRNGKHFSVPGK